MNAKEARLMTDTAIKNNLPDMDIIMTEIKSRAGAGESLCLWYGSLSEETVKYLKELGYQIEEKQNICWITW